MKKVKMLIPLIAVALTMIGALCWIIPTAIYGGNVVIFNKNYVVTEADGVLALEFGSKYDALNENTVNKYPDLMVSGEAPKVKFTSFTEMKSDIKKGKFTDGELSNISRFDRNEENKVIVMDVDELHEVVFPASLGLNLSSIEWTGSYYSASYNWNGSGVTAWVGTWTKDYFEEETARLFTDFSQALKDVDSGVIIHDVSTGKYEGSTSVRYRSAFGIECKAVLYKIISEGKTLYVYEAYRPSESETVPTRVEVYLNHGNQYFQIILGNMVSCPTYDEIAAIALKEVS